jgi:integrase
MVRHSHQDALNERQYQRLLDAVDDVKPKFRQECRFALVALGRLGLRAGELTHLREEWIDWDRSLIHIPMHEDCSCGYCRARAKEEAETNDSTIEEMMTQRWHPKTHHASRAVPFDFDDEVHDVVTGFFFHHDGWPASRVAVNRRVSRAADAAGVDVYPHALRATAATLHAYRGVPAVALQSMMGWADLNTAQKYLRLSGGATQNALNDAYSTQ